MAMTGRFFEPKSEIIFHDHELNIVHDLINEYKAIEFAMLDKEHKKFKLLLDNLFLNDNIKKIMLFGKGELEHVDIKAFNNALVPIQYFILNLSRYLSENSGTHPYIFELGVIKQAFGEALKQDGTDISDTCRILAATLNVADSYIEKSYALKKEAVLLDCIQKLQDYKMHGVLPLNKYNDTV